MRVLSNNIICCYVRAQFRNQQVFLQGRIYNFLFNDIIHHTGFNKFIISNNIEHSHDINHLNRLLIFIWAKENVFLLFNC